MIWKVNRIFAPQAIAITAVGLSLLSCGPDKSASAGPPSFPPAPVTVQEVQLEDVPLFQDYSAETFARDMVDVRGRVDGYIEKRWFQVGSDVRAGQVLYTLDMRPYQADVAKAKGDLQQSEANLEYQKRQVGLITAQADLAQAEANLAKARRDVVRLTPLVKEEAAPQQDLDDANASTRANRANVDAKKANVEQNRLSTKAQIATAEAQVESNGALLRTAELNLEYASIKSPISGRVGDSLVPVGGLVSKASTQPLTSVVPLDPIWVRFKVSEGEYLDSQRKRGSGQVTKVPLDLVLADGTTHPFPGHVQNTVNQVDSKTGTLELQATFPNPKHALLPGQFGRIRLRVDERQNVVVVPDKAIQELQGIQSVFTVGPDNKAQVRPVVTGAHVDTRQIIEQGLKPGDRVIVEGTLKVRPGAPVAPHAAGAVPGANPTNPAAEK